MYKVTTKVISLFNNLSKRRGFISTKLPIAFYIYLTLGLFLA